MLILNIICYVCSAEATLTGHFKQLINSVCFQNGKEKSKRIVYIVLKVYFKNSFPGILLKEGLLQSLLVAKSGRDYYYYFFFT